MKEDWIDIILSAVYEASEKILEVYNSGFEVILKEDRSPVTIADMESSRIIVKHLTQTGVAIVSEEEKRPTFESRSASPLIWMVDPLDGTKEFVNKNGEFCICIALIDSGKPTFGLIADPINQEIILGGSAIGAAYHIPYFQKDLFNQPKISLHIPQKKTLVYSRSHFSSAVQGLVNEMESTHGTMEVIKKGSALKFFDLVLSKAQFYPRLAPTMEWDIAAGQAIYEIIGGEVVDFTNFTALTYNKEDLYNPFFIAKPKDLELK